MLEQMHKKCLFRAWKIGKRARWNKVGELGTKLSFEKAALIPSLKSCHHSSFSLIHIHIACGL